MYLIAGLGNPGKQYEATRHNMGFDTVDCLVEKHNIPQGGVKFNAMYGTEKFIRIRVGVGAKPKDWDLADFVLGHFSDSDRKLVDEGINDAAEAVEMILSEGVDAAMNKYNRKKPKN